MNTKIVFDKDYSDESLIDLPEDIEYMDMKGIPKDKYGLHLGTFHVVVTWTPDELDEE